MLSVEEQFIHNISILSPGLCLTDHQMEQFDIFYSNLIEWNRRVNLTSILTKEDIYIKHFLDSLSILCCVPRETFSDIFSAVDVGTGAGFPGLPLAISFPDANFTLLDSMNKRICFLEDTVYKTGLKNVKLIHGRAEDLGHDSMWREQYDLAVSRAVAKLNVISEYCLPFVKPGGSFIAYKSEKVKDEIEAGTRAASTLGADISSITSFCLPGTVYKRTLVKIDKKKNTPERFPRKAGTPTRDPLN